MSEMHLNFYFLFILSSALIMLIIGALPVSVHAYNINLSISDIPQFQGQIGADITGEFYGAHWGARNNTIITDFIDTYGISSWRHEQAYYGYRYLYVYVEPEKECSKVLVFLYYIPDLTETNNRRVIWAKLIDNGVELPRLTDDEAHVLGIIGNSTPEISPSNTAAATRGFVPETAIASIILSLLIIKIKRRS